MAYSLKLNDAAIRQSLVTLPRGIPRTSVPRLPAAAPPAPKTSCTRGKEQLSHLFAIVYPRSLVEGPKGVAPASVSAGLEQRHKAAEARRMADRCPVRATPARTRHCESASIAADVALAAYHEAAKRPNGDEDGLLQDVVDLSLAMDEACAVDDFFDHAE